MGGGDKSYARIASLPKIKIKNKKGGCQLVRWSLTQILKRGLVGLGIEVVVPSEGGEVVIFGGFSMDMMS